MLQRCKRCPRETVELALEMSGQTGAPTGLTKPSIGGRACGKSSGPVTGLVESLPWQC
jgi:hypothetical protein